MPLATTALNSYAWVATGRTTYAWGEAADCEREWGEAAEALAAAPTPVPYPWNLVGSRRAEDALNWLLEAEKKHGSVASLALANWCALTTAHPRRRTHDGALAPRRGERPACTCSPRRPLPSSPQVRALAPWRGEPGGGAPLEPLAAPALDGLGSPRGGGGACRGLDVTHGDLGPHPRRAERRSI